jgi:hypothetical protein
MSSEKIQSFKKASKSLKKYLKLHAFFKKASYSEKKKARGNCHNGQSAPG